MDARSGTAPETVHKTIVRRIQSLSFLPTTVSVAVRLFQLERGENANPADYARVIASDAGLAGRILTLANSPWYGLPMKVTQPLVAVNLFGITAVRTLAINFCLSGLHGELKLNKEEGHQLWKASLCKAVAAREVARGLDPKLAEEAYLAGLFQDIALPVMLAAAPELTHALLDQPMNTAWRLESERAAMGADHAAFGGVLATRLRLPEQQARMIATHHDLAGLRSLAPEPLSAGAYAASLFPHRLDSWDPTDVERLREFLAGEAGGKRELEPFLSQVSTECKREFAYFDRSKVTEVKFMELISAATREVAEDAQRLVESVHEMKQHVASADQAVARLANERSLLAEQAARDPLTGALNRAGFQQDCQQALARVRAESLPVALVFIDVDRFKELNDRWGHTAGDDALRQIVAVTRECSRNTDLIGRLGGDEFAVLLPNCTEKRAAEIANHIRDAVKSRTLQQGASMSISVGLVWVRGGDPLTLDALIGASDQRMYAAKRAGGNTVRAG